MAQPTVTDCVAELRVKWKELTKGMSKEEKAAFANVERLKERCEARRTAQPVSLLGNFQDANKTLQTVQEQVSGMSGLIFIISTHQLIPPDSWLGSKRGRECNLC